MPSAVPPGRRTDFRRRPPLLGQTSGPGRLALLAIGGFVVLLVVILLAAGVFSGSGHHKAASNAANSSAPPAASPPATGRHRRGIGHLSVAVLNGTTVPGLARRVADRIVRGGFRVSTVTNATNQQHRTTVVAYGPGRQSEAASVARALNLGSSALSPLDASSRVVARRAPIVVTVGADAAGR